MKNKLKIISLVLMILIVSTASFANVKFTDIKGDEWYGSTAIALAEKGLIKGYPDGSFGANKNITVGEFITVVTRSIDPTLGSSKTGKWYQTYVDKATQIGLVKSGEFNSSDYDRPITRGEMARILVRKVERDESVIQENLEYSTSIKDYQTIEASYKSFILKSYITGLMGGYPDGEFRPSQLATRADSSVMLHRLINPSIRLKPVLATLPGEEQEYVSNEGTPMFNGEEIEVKPFLDFGITPYTDVQAETYSDVMKMLDEKYSNVKIVSEYNDIISSVIVDLYPLGNQRADIRMFFNFNNYDSEYTGFVTIVQMNKKSETDKVLKDIAEKIIPGQSSQFMSRIEEGYNNFVKSKDNRLLETSLGGVRTTIDHYSSTEVFIEIFK